jgi:predicted GNAT family acetyltransferase
MDRIDYDLMTLDKQPFHECFCRGPSDLVLRMPAQDDADELYRLQAAYEEEEVIPRGGSFYPAACRKTLEKLLKSDQILIACLGKKIVGKININAVSFTRCQIGGVYVRPEYRGLGIAVKMSAVFLKKLTAEGRGITLFVKKRNSAARKVYLRLGFEIRGDYRISYY